MKIDRSTKWKPVPHANETFRTEFQTPQWAAKYMCSLIPDDAVTVLEPTPGLGNIVREIPPRCEVFTPDDYFAMDKKQRFDCIVMNPPFSSKWCFNIPDEHLMKAGMRLGYYIMMECCQMSDTVIALMPWFTISDSDTRLRSIKRFGLRSVTALPRKTFQYARIQTVVLHMEKGFKGQTVFHSFDCMDDASKPQLF